MCITHSPEFFICSRECVEVSGSPFFFPYLILFEEEENLCSGDWGLVFTELSVYHVKRMQSNATVLH